MGFKLVHWAVLGVLFFCQFSASLASGKTDPNESAKYLDAVSEFADNVLKYGRDTYGPKHTPLFVDGLNVNTHEPVKWISPKGDVSKTTETEEWILSNFASQQTLLRTLDGLSAVTGDPKYRNAAMQAIKYAFENLRAPNGLFYWGEGAAYDALGDTACGNTVWESIKLHYPYYELMWNVDSEATKKLIEAIWSAHVLDWSNLDIDRGGFLDEDLEEPWNHEYKGAPTFFKSKRSWGIGSVVTASSLIQSGIILNKLSGKQQPLVWSKRLAKRFVGTRHPTTGISSLTYNNTWMRVGEDMQNHFRDPHTTVFPWDLYQNSFRHYYPENAQAQPWMVFFLVGEMLAKEHREFTQWALEELTAWGKASYRKKDNSFVPMLTDGTSLEGYVWKDGSGQSSGYNVVNLYPADMSFFWAYSLAYSKTGDGFMWQMLKDIAAGNGLGEIGQILTPHPELQLDTACDHPYGVFGFLELYRSTKQPDYLKMACRIADNIVENRLHKGFFVPTKKHLYTRFDCFEPLALLRLEAAMRYKSDAVPQPWPSIPLFVNKYRYKIQGIDRHVIYGFTESSEPPISIEEAAAIGDVDRIRQLIEQGANVGDFDSLSYMTPLHRAAKEGQKPVVELLLANGAPVNERDLELKTPLHYAVENRYEGIVELLLAHGAGINNKDRRGRTPMDIISRNDNPIKKLLLVKAAETSIHAAAILGDQAQVKVFLDQGIDVDVNDDKGNTSLFYAVRESHDELSRFLIDQGADINYTDKNGYIPLSWALWNEDREMMKLLVTNCADVNFVAKDDWPFLHYLAENNDRELVELFLSHGAKLNVKDNESLTELHIAVSEGNRDLARFLVSKGATALELHLAVCLGDLARVKSLVEEGVDVDTKDESGWTPLYWAASTAEEEVAEFLIGKGAGIDVRANNNCTPLHQAAFVGAAQLASLLISKGADSNARDEGNGTPLHSAAEGGHKDVVELLLANGADVNAKGKDGRGPLHRAVQAGHREVVQLLLANGADVSAKNNKGFTPLDMATMMSRLPKFKAVQEEIVKILTKAAEEQKAEEKERTEKKPSSESPDMSAGVMQQAIIPPFFSLPFTNPIGNDELANVLWLRRLQGLPSVAGGTYSLRVSMTGALGCQRNLGRITYFGILILIDRSDHGYTNQTRIHKNDGGSRGFCGGLFAAA